MPEINVVIKQSKFNSPQQKAQVNLIYTYNFFNNTFKQEFQKYNILTQHYNILKILKGAKKPLTYSDMLAVMLDKTRDLTRLLQKLEKINYIQKTVKEDNKRSIQIVITELGLAKTEDLEKKITESIFKNTNLNDEEAEKLSELLDKMRG